MASIEEKKVNGSVHDADEITPESVKAGISVIANKTETISAEDAPIAQNGDARKCCSWFLCCFFFQLFV